MTLPMPDRADLQAEAVRLLQQMIHRDIDAIRERVLYGPPACRTFVCQGCGVARAILHGSSVKCGCGVTSSAEVLPP